ncbi:MAG: coenzyme F420-0:L-glutamate ligase [Candidatus Pacebacteria bacterium]|nr:coenzyme F420-0:L-glutamate ligase [Candidatus Paceibacterota bacterium]
MQVDPFKMAILEPPQDDLLAKIKESELSLQEGDVVCIASKVVAIHQGRCVPREGTDKDELIKKESTQYLDRSEVPGSWVMHTITNNTLCVNAGIDPFAGYYVLWPEKPEATAGALLEWFKKEYKLKTLYLVITDSHSVPLRRGVVGTALAWAGFDPLFDNRATVDLLGHTSGGSQTNVPDSLAAAAVFVMGEQNEQTPLVRIRNAPYVGTTYTERKKTATSFEVPMEEDIFAPFLTRAPWKQGGANAQE